jgi:hypothetical protein
MKNSKVLKGILILLGLNLTVLGSWRVIDPIAFFEFSGMILSNDVGLLSEARGAGGAVVGFGILILLGVFNQKLSYTSTIVAIVLYLGFGVARVIGFVLDGNPGEMIVQGIIGEFVFGFLGVFALFKYREKS